MIIVSCTVWLIVVVVVVIVVVKVFAWVAAVINTVVAVDALVIDVRSDVGSDALPGVEIDAVDAVVLVL